MPPRNTTIPVDDVPIKRMGEFIPGEYIALDEDDTLEDAKLFRVSDEGIALLVGDKLYGFHTERLIACCKAAKTMSPMSVDELMELVESE